MSENKQTAVEWLVDQVEDFLGLLPVDLIQQAKAMEKEQIKDAFHKCSQKFFDNEEAEQYYKETYEN